MLKLLTAIITRLSSA